MIKMNIDMQFYYIKLFILLIWKILLHLSFAPKKDPVTRLNLENFASSSKFCFMISTSKITKHPKRHSNIN